MDYKNLKELAKILAKANPSAPTAYSYGQEQYSYEELNTTFRNEINKLAGTYQLYRKNKIEVFTLMEEAINAVLPMKVMEQYGQFAEIKTYNQGDKPVFTIKVTAASRRRAKKFITKVGLAGVYEVFKLDGANFEVPTSAFGGAAQIGLEEFLDGRIDFADLTEIVMEGLDEAIYSEIQKALVGCVGQLQGANKASDSGFVETTFDNLLAVADSYGQSTIYCTYEFASKLVPATGWVSDDMRNQKWNNGYLANYKNHKVVVLRQSYADETNSTKVINPRYVYIIPTGADKPIKVAFEGSAIVDESKNKDGSREIQVYQKFGTAAVVTNNICIYQDTTFAV